MQHIFDHKNKFYKHLIDLAIAQNAVSSNKDNNGANNAVTNTDAGNARVTDMNEAEREWRLSLNIGHTVDVFKRDWKRGSEMWTKGKIVAVTGSENWLSTKMLTITFFGDNSVGDEKFQADSQYIAPFNTLSSEDNWRSKIEKYTEVDALDTAGNWRTGTILWLDDKSNTTGDEYAKYPMCRFGARLYSPDGDKKDEDGTYIGGAESLDRDADMYIGIWTTRIQKKFTQTALRDLPGNSVRMSDEDIASMATAKPGATKYNPVSDWEKQSKQDVKDMEQITEDGPSIIVAVERDICKSELLVELLKRFSDAQGFESILEVIAH